MSGMNHRLTGSSSSGTTNPITPINSMESMESTQIHHQHFNSPTGHVGSKQTWSYARQQTEKELDEIIEDKNRQIDMLKTKHLQQLQRKDNEYRSQIKNDEQKMELHKQMMEKKFQQIKQYCDSLIGNRQNIEYQTNIVSLQQQLNSAKNQALLSKENTNILNALLEKKQGIIEGYISQIQQLTSLLEKNQKKMQSKNQQLGEDVQAFKENQLKRYESENNRLNTDAKKQANQLFELLGKYSKQIGELKKTISTLKGEINTLTQQNFSLEKDKSQLKITQEKYRKKIDQLSKQITLIKNNSAAKLAEVQRLKDNKKAQLEYDYNKTKNQLYEKLKQVQQQSIYQRLKWQKQLENQLRLCQSDFEAKAKNLKYCYKQLQTKNKQLENQKSKDKEELQSQKQQIRHLKKIVEDNGTVFSNIKTSICRLPEKPQNINLMKMDSHQLPEVVHIICRSLIDSKNKLAKQLKQSDQAKKLIASYCSNIKESISDTLKGLKTNRNMPFPKFNQSNQNFNLGGVLNELINHFISKTSNIENELNNCRSQNEQLKRKIDENKRQLSTKQIQMEKISKESQSLNLQIDQLKTKLTFKQVQNKTYKATKEKEMNQKIVDMQHNLSELQQKINSQELQYEEKTHRMSLENNSFNSLKEQMQKTIEQLMKEKEQLNNDLSRQQQITKKQTSDITTLKAELETKKLSLDLLNKENDKIKQQAIRKEQMLKDEFDQTLKNEAQKICSAIRQAYDSEPTQPTFNSISRFINQNAGSSITSFQVSHILEKVPKERNFLIAKCCEFLKCQRLTTKLLFKADDFSKNFSNYLPSSTNKFSFAVLAKSKKDSLFCMVAQYLAKDAPVIIFNLTDKNVLKKSERSRANSCSYDNNMLRFGNDEIVIKNNNLPFEVSVVTMIIGQKCFSFKKEELLGQRQESNKFQLEALEIHRLYVGQK